MAKIDLNDEDWDKEVRTVAREGDKVMAAIGYNTRTLQSGVKVTDVMCVVLDDQVKDEPDVLPPNDNGMTVRLSLWQTPRGRREGVVPLMKAMGWDPEEDGVIDDEDEADLSKLLMHNVFLGKVIHEAGRLSPEERKEGKKPRTWANVAGGRTLRRFEGDYQPEWDGIRNEAAQEYARIQAEREAGGSGGHRGGGGGGSTYTPDSDVGF